MQQIVVLFALVFSILIGSDRVFAAGFQLPEQGIAAMGQGDAFVGQADDPSAVYYNPAGILQLEGTQATLGATLIHPSTTFTNQSTSLSTIGPTGPSGRETDEKEMYFLLPHLYVTHRLTDKLGFGFGTFIPFGLTTEWPSNWEGRFISYRAAINSYYFNPVVAFQPEPGLMLSAGIQLVHSTAEVRRKIDLTPLIVLGCVPCVGAEGDLDLKDADGDGWGYNLGALVPLSEKNKLGVTFRSPVRIHYKGDADFTIPGAIPAPFAALFPDGEVSTDITMPGIFEVGLTNQSFSKWTLSFDLQWVGWSSFKTLSLDFANDPGGILDNSVPKNWNDVINFRLGAEYELSSALALRMGYVWDPTPVPPETLDTLLPDNNRHDVSIGLGYKSGPIS
ncbi:MAG: outer membrane protein transport protein, partial [Nitrospira sp.]|nr:outer membrane protein transport protein [Nitrospira sp.]